MRVKAKLDAALVRRQAEYTPRHPVSGSACQRPGSQNRKKGIGRYRGRRRR